MSGERTAWIYHSKGVTGIFEERLKSLCCSAILYNCVQKFGDKG